MERVKSTGSFGFLLAEIALALCIMTVAMGSFVFLYARIAHTVEGEYNRIRALWRTHRQFVHVYNRIRHTGLTENKARFEYDGGVIVARRDQLYPSYIHVVALNHEGELVCYKGCLT